jgi:hypothetical protein
MVATLWKQDNHMPDSRLVGSTAENLHPSEARYKKSLGQWVPEGYETGLEELHRTVATNALEAKFDAS